MHNSKKKILLMVGLIAFGSVGGALCDESANSNSLLLPGRIEVVLKNPIDIQRADAVVNIPLDRLRKSRGDFNPKAFAVFNGDKMIPAQAGDRDGDDQFDEVILVTDFQPHQEKKLTIRYSPDGKLDFDFPKRTYAELSLRVGATINKGIFEGGEFIKASSFSLPAGHVPNDALMRYEGPGWESDKVGYRLYFDQRNRIDIFGKKTARTILQNVGHGKNSYHNLSEWGMDILKVGNSLGLGSIGMMFGGKIRTVSNADAMKVLIAEDGALRSHVQVNHKGWKVGGRVFNIKSDLMIHAGSRMTHHVVHISGEPENLVTGIVKHKKADYFHSPGDRGGWGYIASYGRQSLANDNLGMAILYKKSQLMRLSEDGQNHLVVFKPEAGSIEYYFLAAWQQEMNGISDKEAFRAYLEQAVRKANNPITISLKQHNAH